MVGSVKTNTKTQTKTKTMTKTKTKTNTKTIMSGRVKKKRKLDHLMVGKCFTDQGLDTQIYASYAAQQL